MAITNEDRVMCFEDEPTLLEMNGEVIFNASAEQMEARIFSQPP